MPKGGQDIKIDVYEKRLYDMIMADTSPEKDWTGRKQEADTIMARLLGDKWNSIGDKKNIDYINKLDEAGNQYDLGRAPLVPGPLDADNKPTDKADSFLTMLRDALNKMIPDKKKD